MGGKEEREGRRRRRGETDLLSLLVLEVKLQDSSGPEGPGCESRHSEISKFPKSTLKHIHRPRTDIIQSLMTSNNPEGDE